MKWLEEPKNEAERLLREGLDQAAERTGDEITHRRVWAQVSEALEAAQPRFPGRLVFAGAATVLLVAASLVAYPHVRRLSLGHATQSGLAAKKTTTSTVPVAAKDIPGPAAETNAGAEQQTALIEAERIPGHVVSTRKGERARVALGGGAVADLAENSSITWDNQQRPSVEKGSASLSVPHQPPGWRFSVTAGPYVVTVVGTKFEVRVVSRSVGVEVTEGVVEVWRGSHSTRLVAGDSWHGPLYPEENQSTPATTTPAEKPQPLPAPAAKPAIPPMRGLQEAQAALQAGDTNKAVEILSRSAQGSGPAAENAAYELGRITRYNLNRPRQAVALWDKYRTRFPAGLLRTETDLSIVETLSQMGDVRTALAEADAFMARHPTSERRIDVQRLAERLRAAQAASDPK
jgi:ferric-dicitrate binding protein FerR (iron transport regulator)